MLEFPSSELVKPYKQKVAHVLGCINFIGGAGIVMGE